MSSLSGGCVGIAATSATNMANNYPATPNWTFPYACATSAYPHTPDGPSIYYDPGGTDLFAAEHDSSTGHGIVHVYKPCNYGQPGSSACAETRTITLPSNPVAHVTVTTNPCTHDAIAAYKDSSTGKARLDFYNPSTGALIGSYNSGAATLSETTVCSSSACNGTDNGQPGDIPVCNMSCSIPSDCTGTESAGRGCARLADKVNVATTYDSATGACYAYVAYTASYHSLVKPFGVYTEANLDIVNPQAETNAILVKHYSSVTLGGNGFSAVATASSVTGAVGYFFYWQSSTDPCSTYFYGGTDTSYGLTSLTFHQIDGPFPMMRFDAAFGIGDYIGIVKRGLPGGYLFPSWARPVASTGSGSDCVSCQGTKYSLGIYGAQVSP